MLSRRSILSFTALTPLALAGCANFKGLTPTQVSSSILTMLVNAVKTVANAVPQMSAVSPALFPTSLVSKVEAYATDAENVLATINSSVTANAAAKPMSQALTDLGAMLNALSSVGAIPPPFGTYLAAAAIAVNMVSAYISSVTGAAAAPVGGTQAFQTRYGQGMDNASADLILRLGAANRFVGH